VLIENLDNLQTTQRHLHEGYYKTMGLIAPPAKRPASSSGQNPEYAAHNNPGNNAIAFVWFRDVI
jgi:hypothetical protein